MPPTNQLSIPPRFSCSTPMTRLSAFKTYQKISQTSYTKNQNKTVQQQQPSPSISPTKSQITKNRDLKIYTITKEFKIDKQALRRKFYSQNNTNQRKKFFFLIILKLKEKSFKLSSMNF